tara:strand:- start:1143 stop:2174 length:1032 start_codon:yes stop_codon:yes gene_type:complete
MTETSPSARAVESRPTQSIWPGLLLAAMIAGLAFALRFVPGLGMLSPLILAILLGMALRNTLGTPEAAQAGIAISMRQVLRAGIILMGLQLTLGQVAQVGWLGVAVIALSLVLTFGFTIWLGRVLRVDAKLTQLIAAGTSICGASAVIATNTVTRGRDEDVAYAVACVTIFGSLAMILLPLTESWFALGPRGFGLWAGASIHEVAQVVAAAFQRGDEAGQFGTIAKLTRVMMLAPMILCLGVFVARRRGGQSGGGKAPIPWFVFGFIAMVGVASTGWVPEAVLDPATGVTQFLLAMALAAMGLETDLRKLAAAGLRPALLGAGAWVFIMGISLGLIVLTGAAR